MSTHHLDHDTIRSETEAQFKSGLNCAESIVEAALQLGIVDPIHGQTLRSAATGFGRGMGKAQGNCGALIGGIMVLNVVQAQQGTEKRAVTKQAAAFAQAFKENLGHLTCAELLKNKQHSCKDKTCDAALLMAKLLQQAAG